MNSNAEKEITVPGEGCYFDRLPNEVLRMIFEQLSFADLLRISTVCHRWNQVIFHHCNDHILFRPEQCELLCQDRSYKHLDLSACDFPVPSEQSPDYCQEETMLEKLASEQVTSVTMVHSGAHMEQLVRILLHFPRLDSLNWTIFSKMHAQKITTHRRFQQAVQGHLPTVKHLRLYCYYVNMMDFLVDLAPNLVELHVVIPGRLLDRLCKCGCHLTALQSLTLNIQTHQKLHRLKTFRIDEFTKFLKALVNLKKFSFLENDPTCVEAILGCGLQLTDLEILSNYEFNLGRLRSLPNLVSFRTDAQYIQTDKDFQDFFRLIPQITALDIDRAVNVDIERLALMFPDLKVLRMRSRMNWWSLSRELFIVFSMLKHLEVLTLRVGTMSHGMLELFELKNLLPRLREITLVDCVIEPPDFTVFGSILRKPTLRKLNIESETIRRSVLPMASYILPGVNPSCEVFINGSFVRR